MPKRARFQFERVAGSPEIEALQDRLQPMLEHLSTSADDADTATGDAATAAGTTFGGDDSVWAGEPPQSVAEALARLAYHIKSGAGAVPIVELP